MDKTERQILQDMTSYIDELKTKGYYVTLSCFVPYLSAHLPTLLAYEVHPLPLCYYLKRNKKTMGICIKNKARLVEKLPQTSYKASCWAGVYEFIFPVKVNGKTAMCIHLTGFKGDKKELEKAEKLACICGEEFSKLYGELHNAPESFDVARRIIAPLEYMAEAFVLKCATSDNVGSRFDEIYAAALRVMYERLSDDLTTKDIADELGYSSSHLRHLFAERGETISDSLSKIRLNRAADMLKTTPYSVTEIAVRCGFSDSNYFSTTFRRRFGVSPREYRKKS